MKEEDKQDYAKVAGKDFLTFGEVFPDCGRIYDFTIHGKFLR
jgi:hypothetical protein